MHDLAHTNYLNASEQMKRRYDTEGEASSSLPQEERDFPQIGQRLLPERWTTWNLQDVPWVPFLLTLAQALDAPGFRRLQRPLSDYAMESDSWTLINI